MDISDELLKHLDQVLPPAQQKPRLLIGFSGGLDSSVLLFLTQKIRPDSKLSAIHCNHGLNPDSNSWQVFCAGQADKLGVPFIAETLCFPSGFSEAKGREARYEVFKKYLSGGDTLLLAHHLDDQAETLLFRLFRGTGTAGLAAMASKRKFGEGQVMRPLLGFTKQQLSQFAREQNIQWVEDSSNANNAFDRNYIRNQIMPLILKRWPKALDSIKELAVISREDQELLTNYADRLLQQVDFRYEAKQSSLNLASIGQFSRLEIRLVLRRFIESVTGQVLNQALLKEMEQQFLLSSEDSKPCMHIADYEIHRFDSRLFLINELPAAPRGFESEWDGKKPLEIKGLGQLELIEGPTGNFLVRFRQGGERAKPVERAHSQTLKKLFQEYRIEPWLRSRMPLVFLGDELINIGGRIDCSEHRFRIIPDGS